MISLNIESYYFTRNTKKCNPFGRIGFIQVKIGCTYRKNGCKEAFLWYNMHNPSKKRSFRKTKNGGVRMDIALIDDLETDRLQLEQILKAYDRIHQLGMNYYHYSGGEDFLKHYQPFRFTVIFLDIYMNGISGIETAEQIRTSDEDVILIFLTTSEEHRPEAFSLFASSYIKKPCSGEQVFRVLDHIFRTRTAAEKRFSFSFDRKDYSLRLADIVSVETDRNYLTIVDRRGASYRTRMTFSTVESLLDNRFLVLMKGIIVNMDYIVKLSDDSCLMKSGISFPIRIKNQKELQQKWLNYKFAKIRKDTAAMGDTYVYK